ncbi:uncharacterized protein C8Q71DRAFT_358771 [Rhodofomes roseus]|uniref:Uncharacterized protein n=1 Tax=Rhodofomes roseus TaxID=34475 RepID=A0ABQ8K1G3_9APHY|nr:uncharacterized protein C8Q71DRAFT_358771 [Rhodofomes roseus]KAH9830567.1 hypothetical protein C8Q71DRAFT_358771 [Rhodofomes roseus]
MPPARSEELQVCLQPTSGPVRHGQLESEASRRTENCALCTVHWQLLHSGVWHALAHRRIAAHMHAGIRSVLSYECGCGFGVSTPVHGSFKLPLSLWLIRDCPPSPSPGPSRASMLQYASVCTSPGGPATRMYMYSPYGTSPVPLPLPRRGAPTPPVHPAQLMNLRVAACAPPNAAHTYASLAVRPHFRVCTASKLSVAWTPLLLGPLGRWAGGWPSCRSEEESTPSVHVRVLLGGCPGPARLGPRARGGRRSSASASASGVRVRVRVPQPVNLDLNASESSI